MWRIRGAFILSERVSICFWITSTPRQILFPWSLGRKCRISEGVSCHLSAGWRMDSDGTKDLKVRHVAFMRAQVGSFWRCVTLLCVFTHVCPPPRPPSPMIVLLRSKQTCCPRMAPICPHVWSPACRFTRQPRPSAVAAMPHWRTEGCWAVGPTHITSSRTCMCRYLIHTAGHIAAGFPFDPPCWNENTHIGVRETDPGVTPVIFIFQSFIPPPP